MEPEPKKVEWRPVVGYEELYEVSEHGDVRRLGGTHGCKKTRLLTPFPNGPSLRLAVRVGKHGQKQSLYVHRVVAKAFLGDFSHTKLEVDHVDGNWTNNDYRNLEWVTCLENHRRAAVLGLKAKGTRNANAKLTEEDVRMIREMPVSLHKVSAIFGISRIHAKRIRQRLVWAHVV